MVSTLSLLGVDYIENMLRKQLVSAIGKIVGPVDFTNYMRYHMRKVFRAEFQPKPFMHAVRRPEHSPEVRFSADA